MKENNISKGVGEVGNIIMVIVLYALVLGSILGISIFANIDVTGTGNNETLVNVTNITTSSFAIVGTYSTAVCVLDSVHNSTSGQVLTAGNYTASSCTIILDDASTYIGEDLNVTYGWTYESSNTLAGIDVDALSAIFAAFVVAVTAFIIIGGTLLGILWILPYIKPLFRKDALGMSA